MAKKATTRKPRNRKGRDQLERNAATAAKSKAVVLRLLKELHRRHEEHRDPFRAWEAYRLARAFSAWAVGIPDWVLAYFDRAAERMCAIGGWTGLTDPTKPISQLVTAALEMTEPGRGTAFLAAEPELMTRDWPTLSLSSEKRMERPMS
jgi:hypothetical protein